MPGPYPKEFREDVVAVDRRRGGAVTTTQLAPDSAMREATLPNGVRRRICRRRT